MKWIYPLLAVLAGGAVAMQGILNSRLRVHWGLLPALTLSALLVFVPVLLFWLLGGMPLPTGRQLAETRLPIPLGGLFGVAVITLGALVFDRLSATTTLALVLTGQFLVAAVVDHFGLMGMARHPLSSARILALGLVLVAAWLSRR